MSIAAKNLLNRYWDRRLPVDPFKLAAAWGARVVAAQGTSEWVKWFSRNRKWHTLYLF